MKNFKILIVLLLFGLHFSCTDDLETEIPINEKYLSFDVVKILASDNSSLVNINNEINPYLKELRIVSGNLDKIENYRTNSNEINYSTEDILNLGEEFKFIVFDIFHYRIDILHF
jgi:hypothetical protein